MSLSMVLSNALSGIRASSKQADVISTNISNALTEGYARRSVDLSSVSVGGIGGGVRVAGVTRAENPVLSEARRFADAGAGEAGALTNAAARLAAAMGEPGAPGSLAAAADALDGALSRAADTPESAPVLAAAARAAGDYTATVNRIATEAMALRSEADASIAGQVATINATLTKIQSLNAEIQSRSGGSDAAALIDQREQLIREISSMIPVRVVNRDRGAVALYARNGGQLLDGKVFELGFDATNVVTPDLTIENGALGGLTSAGIAIAIGENDQAGLFDGGALSAAFAVRDRQVPAVAAALDALAADLAARVQAPGVDPTLSPTDAALFTDSGARFDPADEIGFALRISLNAVVDPDQGGDPVFLRAGLLAAGPGVAGDDQVLRNLQDALTAPVAAAVGSGLSGARGAAGFAAEVASAALAEADRFDEAAAFASGRADELADSELSETGVDSDQELSRLLLVEQSFNANARVIQVVDDLLARLTQL